MVLDEIEEKEVQDLKAEISKLRIENRKQAKELSTLSKVIDGPLGPQTEAEIIKRENNELKQELGELRKTMLRQEQNYNKKIGNARQDPVEDWKKGQIDKLHRQLAEAEQRTEECLAEKMKLEEEVLRGKDKIAQLRETRDTLRSANDSINAEMKKTTEKLEAEISELHGKYLAQGRELGEAEKLSQSADNMRGLVERLTIENEELTRQNNQLSLQTTEFEKMIEKLKNKVSSMEVELEYKRKREVEEEERKWKKRDDDDDLSYLTTRRQTSRPHPLIAKSEDSNYKSSVAAQLNFSKDEEEMATSTPYTRKSAPYTSDTNRRSDLLPSTRDQSAEQLYRNKHADSYKQTDRHSDHHMEANRRMSHSGSEFDVKTATENHSAPYESKFTKPSSYSKPTDNLNEDDTYREALAIVEKYKKLDLSAENTASDNHEKSKPYNNLSSVYDRVKPEPTDSSSDKRRTSEKKWNSGGADENNLDNNNLNESTKPWNSTAWLRQQGEGSYNGGSYNTGTNPNIGYTSSNGYGSTEQIDYIRSGGRKYDTGSKYSYSGKSYTLPEKNTSVSSRGRARESDDEVDKPEPRATQPPQNINEVQLGSRVVFKRGSDLERGTVRYAGRLVGKDGQYLGIELNTNTGNHDGTYQSHTYFKCKPKRGIFIPINKVQLVYPSV